MTVDRKATRRYAREEQQMSNELSSAEVPADPPVDLEILTAAWTATTGCGIDQIRAALATALPTLRRQIAEEIAAALDERHRCSQTLWGGDKDVIPTYGRVGLATGYQRAAQIAREIGTKEAS